MALGLCLKKDSENGNKSAKIAQTILMSLMEQV